MNRIGFFLVSLELKFSFLDVNWIWELVSYNIFNLLYNKIDNGFIDFV